jgi:hypothetical protein
MKGRVAAYVNIGMFIHNFVDFILIGEYEWV